MNTIAIFQKKLNKLGRFIAIRKRKAKLKNHSFSIISNTCVGGVMTHFVGEQFRSPTVNLIIWEKQFITFCNNLKYYVNCPIEELSAEEKSNFQELSYPIGVLRGGSLPDIYLLFVHYKTLNEAMNKWYERCKRINYDNIFIVMDRGIEASDQILDEFNKIPYQHKVIFTHKENFARWPNNFKFDCYTPEKFKNGILYDNIRKGITTYSTMDEFDFVSWLNDGTIKKNITFEKNS